MKAATKTVYWAAAIAVVFVIILLVNGSTSELIGSPNAKDVSRFGPDSIDVQMGMGTFQRDAPRTLASQPQLKPLLLFPPSQQDLEKLSGPV